MLTRTDRRRFPILLAVIAALAMAMLFSPVQAQEGSAPDKPRGLEATATHDSVTLSWDNPQDESITGYVILRRIPGVDPQGHFNELVADTGSAATTYTDGTVSAETRYTYRIKAINEHGVSERSRWSHINVPAAPEPEEEQAAEPPDQPTGLEATAAHDSVTLTWDDPGDDTITGYVILRRVPGVDPQGHFNELVSNTGTDATTYTDDTVSAETRYTYRIKAINEHGVSERSRWSHIDVPAAPEAAEGDEQDGQGDGGGAPGGPGKKANRSEGRTVLVSNMGQAADADAGMDDTVYLGQAFSIAAGSGNYTLTSIEIAIEGYGIAAADIDSLSVSVWSTDSSGFPSASLHALTNPASITADTTATFNAQAGATLEEGTTYAVVVHYDKTISTNPPEWSITESEAFDAGPATGWSLPASSLYREASSNTWETFAGEAYRMRVNGAAAGGDTPACTLNEGDHWCGVVTVGPIVSGTNTIGHGYIEFSGITGGSFDGRHGIHCWVQ